MAEAKTARPKLKTPPFRVHFPAVFEFAKQMEDSTGKPAYEVTGTFDPKKLSKDEKKQWADIVAECNRACIEKFKKPLDDIKLPKFNFPFYDAEQKEHLQGFEAGHVAFKMKTWTKPGVVGPDGRTPLTSKDQFYPGCYAKATVSVQAYDIKGGKGVAIRLNNVMFLRDGERLDGRTNAEDDFGEDAVAADDMDDLT